MEKISINLNFLYNFKINIYEGDNVEFLNKFPEMSDRKPIQLGRTYKNPKGNIEILLNIKKIGQNAFNKECVLLHELVHAIDFITGEFSSISEGDFKIKSILLGTAWRKLKQKKIISGEIIRKDSSSTALSFIWTVGKDKTPTKLIFEKEFGEFKNLVTENNIVIPPEFDESDILEKIYRKELKAFSKRNITDKETRAYTLGALWGELIEKEY